MSGKVRSAGCRKADLLRREDRRELKGSWDNPVLINLEVCREKKKLIE
jgi:hypothetical protein